MSRPAQPLTFAAVDGLGFAAARGLLRAAQDSAPYCPTSLGPLFELLHLANCGRLPLPSGGTWLADNGAAPMIAALKENREFWVNPSERRMGFSRAICGGPDGDARLTGFFMDAKRAASNTAKLPGSAPAQLVAAMAEMESNIHEHSEARKRACLPSAPRTARSSLSLLTAVLESRRACALAMLIRRSRTPAKR